MGDPSAVASYYGKVLGWRVQPSPFDPAYTTFAARNGPIAGATAPGAQARDAGTRPHWIVYLGAEDVDATLAIALKLGAKPVHAATDIPQVGRYAVLSDPQGAVFALYKPVHLAPERKPQNGEHIWLELATTDLEAAYRFYQELFGWQVIERMDMGAMGIYLIFGTDGQQRGGIFKLAPHIPAPYWLSYTSVADVDKAIAASTKAGGRVLSGPHTVPGGGRIAQLLDPGGAVFAIHTTPKKPETPANEPAASTAEPAPAEPAPAAPPAPATVPTLAPAVVEPVAAKPAAPPTAAPKTPARAAAAYAKAPATAPPAPAKSAPPAATPKPAAAKTAVAPTPAKTVAKKKPAAKKKVAAKKAVAKSAKKKVTAKKKAAPKKKVAAKKAVAAKSKSAPARAAVKKSKPAPKSASKKDKKKDKKEKKGKKHK
jgi:predicted enzyme related to lactoylglutathione lyase